ncbi:MAG: nitroreductase family protein [Deltaproteobacteria bacterium]|nr:nitroreductase family protein [Deltaproteobacteria bacterium]
MDLLEGIMTRRSVREFSEREVSGEELEKILAASSRAPSGLNNQPWRFVIVRSASTRGQLAALTRYGPIIRNASLCLAVFLDGNAVYHHVKDCQAIGACLQNMLLAAHGLGLGGVWLGEILKNGAEVRRLLEVGEDLELMAVLALGEPKGKGEETDRKRLQELVLKEW